MNKITKMLKLINKPILNNVVSIKKYAKLTIDCERCGIQIGQGHTYGYLFYCDECMRIMDRAKAVQDFDTD